MFFFLVGLVFLVLEFLFCSFFLVFFERKDFHKRRIEEIIK